MSFDCSEIASRPGQQTIPAMFHYKTETLDIYLVCLGQVSQWRGTYMYNGAFILGMGNEAMATQTKKFQQPYCPLSLQQKFQNEVSYRSIGANKQLGISHQMNLIKMHWNALEGRKIQGAPSCHTFPYHYPVSQKLPPLP